MSVSNIEKINIIGAGNVATHLAFHLKGKIHINTIFSNSLSRAEFLANQVGAKSVTKISELDEGVHLNLICVSDDAIESVAYLLPKHIPVVHTSGTIGMDVLSQMNEYGIMYPLQTFSKGREIEMNTVPFLLEANSVNFYKNLEAFCHNQFSQQTLLCDSVKRKQIHLAAVLVSNFTTQLSRDASAILKAVDLPLNILKPLMKEVLSKIEDIGPEGALTGPAKRKDLKVIENHLSMIEDEKLKLIYQLISERIIATT